MVWDRTRPTNTERIQNLGNVIRPNWTAIEEASNADADEDKLKIWAVNLVDRSQPVVTGPSTPARIGDNVGNNAEAGIIYCRNDDDNNELFFLDSQDPANEVQLTRDDRIGRVNQGVNASNLWFDEDSTKQVSYGQSQMIIAFGNFNSDGSITANQLNMTGNAKAGNTYTVSVDPDVLTSANYLVMLTSASPDNKSERVINWITKPAPSVGVKTDITLAIVSGSGSSRSAPFDVIIIGGR